MSMAADSDGGPRLASTKRVLRPKRHCASSRVCEEDNDLIQTVFTCHGNIDDPDFPQRLAYLLDQLSTILSKDKNGLKKLVKKVEPWNSVRVTLNIPREAAARLRALAAAGDAALQALGILSVQVEGDQVISLRLAAQAGAEPQEIVLRTSNTGMNPGGETPATAASSSASAAGPVAALLQAIPGPSGSSSNGFKSPNVVAPVTKSVIPPSPRPHSGRSPFPFTSMTHAAQTHARQDGPHHNFTPPPPPPPYVSKTQASRVLPGQNTPSVSSAVKSPMAVDTPSSSPLLVNLLQNDGKDGGDSGPATSAASHVRPLGPHVTTHRASAPRAAPVPAPPAPLAAPLAAPTRPPFVVSKEASQPRPSAQGFSQFTAASSKPCTSREKKEVSEKAQDANAKKLIINPLTGELEPMPSESSDSEEDHGSREEPFFCPSSPSTRHSDENSHDEVWLNSRRGDVSDESDGDAAVKGSGSELMRRRTNSALAAPEKIKLKLTVLDKPESGPAPAQAYKVDLSFSPSVRKSPSNSGGRCPPAGSCSPVATAGGTASAASEELRVPPLHISLRGRNATVVSNKNKTLPWLLDKEQLYPKLAKKKTKLGSGAVKDGRDSTAITNSDESPTQKPKRTKLKRVLNSVDRLRVKIPYVPDVEDTDLVDEKTSKKRKDSKKLKNSLRYSESDGEGSGNLKMDSEEWISRTLKEETLRRISVPGGDAEGLGDAGGASEEEVVAAVAASPLSAPSGDARVPPIQHPDGGLPKHDPSRTSPAKPSELLFCKNLDNSSKKLDCLKTMNNLFTDSELLTELMTSGESSSVKKPQEIGGKIKSELSSKIARVSGKLQNDLSKDGSAKRKSDESACKAVKSVIRSKVGKKESPTLRSGSCDVPAEEASVNRAKRRHSGDTSATESQAQKVKRSSSSDQPNPVTKPLIGTRRLDSLPRKIRKDHVIDRLRKDKLAKTTLNAKLTTVNELMNTKAAAERITGNGAVKAAEEGPAGSLPLTVVPETDKLKECVPAEGNTQGEDSGIESMDALSEKSPNQGESPCRKEEEAKKGQNHDRTVEEEGKQILDNCLTLGNSNQKSHPPQAHTVPFESSSRNNNAALPESDSRSTKLPEPAGDELIDSFEVKIREAFRRDEDPTREGLAAKILEGSSKDWGKPPLASPAADKKPTNDVDSEPKESSPCLEDMERFRVNPPLYTYAKREDSLSPSPTTVEPQETNNHVKDEENAGSKAGLGERESVKAEEPPEADAASTGRNLRNKSLLEQLLIEIPEDTRRTRSWHKLGNSPGDTPKSSPRPASPSVARASPRAAKHSPTPRTTKRPNKRKCSENAAELIKACMGVDDGKIVKPTSAANWKRGDGESSDDEPLSEKTRSREQSVEQDTKPSVLKTKVKQIVEEESRNNNKVGVKIASDTPTRRSGRQTQGCVTKALRTVGARSTRSQEACDTGNKRRRTSRDGK